mgnify:CR=1 FL=1
MWINFRAIFAVLGYLTLGIGILMLVCSVVELFTTQANLDNFLIIGLLLSFLGFAFAFSNNKHINSKMTLKHGFFLTTISWFWITFIASLPFYFANLNITFASSLFEAMSAFSTTGATVFPRLEELSYGLHLWRALLQWIGGIGIILTGTALISQLSSGGMQLFKIEAFETFDNPLDRAIDIIKGIIKIYMFLTIIFFLAMWLIAGLAPFDALMHTLTGISTAGFSNKDASIGFFNNYYADIILILMMICGGSPFILIYYAVFLKKPGALLYDDQFRYFIIFVVVLSLILAGWLFFYNNFSLKKSLIYGTFTIVSMMTGTGSVVADYSSWGYFPSMLILIVMFIGGCGGSSACGMKIYRILIAFRVSKVVMQRIFQKNHIILPYYNKTVIDDQFAYSIFAYMFLMFSTIAVVALILAALGLDFITALTGSITCLMNVGPAFGSIIGPEGTFASLPDSAKLVLVVAMFVGRIEIFGAYVLFYRSFWQS